jgi:hypothetical protein
MKAHEYPEVYRGLGLNLNTLGCVMLDLEPVPQLTTIIQDHKDGSQVNYDRYMADYWHISPNPERFWIDGYVVDKKPHVTLLYGLLQTAKNYQWHIEQVLNGWNLDEVQIDHFGYFPSPYQDEEYYCIVGHIKITDKLLEGHERLCMLPHIKTFPGYKAHVTVAYIKKDDAIRDEFIRDLDAHFSGKSLRATGLNFGGTK